VTADPIAHKITELEARKEQARNAGSPRAIERQHEKGKLLARERLELLLDPSSFHELDLLARHRAHAAGLEERPYTDGVVTGWGTIDNRKVFVYSQDFTVFGGALGEVFAEKIHKLMDLALKTGAPVIGLNDGAGARIQEGVVSRRHFLAQRAIFGCDSANFGGARAMRRWSGVFAGDDRFYFHGARNQPHVHHRP
jgi:acetyl-CoA carboxylase carboxyltransferase component